MYYNLFGPKWGSSTYGTESGEITWTAEFGSNFQFDGGDTQADFDAALQDAFDAWETVADINFTYVSPDDTTTPIDIDVSVGAIDGAWNTVGQAFWSSTSSSITSGSVLFDEAEDWAPNGNPGEVDFYAVALHEIGHVLGLRHFDSNDGEPLQIMNSRISVDELQSGDIAGAQALYGAGDGIAPPPPPPPPPPEDPEVPPPPPPEEPEAPPPPPPSPPEEDSDPPSTPETVPEDDGGSSGGALGILVALLGVVAAMLFGGGAALVGVAAGRVAEDDDADETPAETEADVLATDLLPVVQDFSHSVYVDDFGNFIEGPDHDHEHGCDCGHCCGADEDMFLV